MVSALGLLATSAAYPRLAVWFRVKQGRGALCACRLKETRLGPRSSKIVLILFLLLHVVLHAAH